MSVEPCLNWWITVFGIYPKRKFHRSRNLPDRFQCNLAKYDFSTKEIVGPLGFWKAYSLFEILEFAYFWFILKRLQHDWTGQNHLQLNPRDTHPSTVRRSRYTEKFRSVSPELLIGRKGCRSLNHSMRTRTIGPGYVLSNFHYLAIW
jgi:hypothetical protein